MPKSLPPPGKNFPPPISTTPRASSAAPAAPTRALYVWEHALEAPSLASNLSEPGILGLLHSSRRCRNAMERCASYSIIIFSNSLFDAAERKTPSSFPGEGRLADARAHSLSLISRASARGFISERLRLFLASALPGLYQQDVNQCTRGSPRVCIFLFSNFLARASAGLEVRCRRTLHRPATSSI